MLVCQWLFVSSPHAITVFVSNFGAVLGPMFGIMVADYDWIRKQQVVLDDLYTMSPAGSLHYDGGWNRKALVALGLSGALSIGLALAGAFGLMPDVGDWGWLISASSGALLYRALSRPVIVAMPTEARA